MDVKALKRGSLHQLHDGRTRLESFLKIIFNL